MDYRVAAPADLTDALTQTDEFLGSRPVAHNLVLTILRQGVRYGFEGRCFLVVDDDNRIAGVAVQAPSFMRIALTPTPLLGLRALVAAIDGAVPGIIADAATAAAFAGHWTEVHDVGVGKIEGQRLYELSQLQEPAGVPGELRSARAGDIDTLHEWARGFAADTGDNARRPEAGVDAAMHEGLLYVWDHDGPRAMARGTKPAAGVVRVGAVYTPPADRGRGYASACTASISRRFVGAGNRCILYTQLSNPISNAIYRRIGYEAVAEVLAYDFAP